MIELIIILGVGVVLGMYITSQIKCNIRRNIFNKNVEEYEKKKECVERVVIIIVSHFINVKFIILI